MNQIAWRFDKETLRKVGKALFIAVQYGASVALLAILQQAGTLDLGPITPVVGAMLPLIVEVIRQWSKGTKDQLEK